MNKTVPAIKKIIIQWRKYITAFLHRMVRIYSMYCQSSPIERVLGEVGGKVEPDLPVWKQRKTHVFKSSGDDPGTSGSCL
jgi:hypothetical protein